MPSCCSPQTERLPVSHDLLAGRLQLPIVVGGCSRSSVGRRYSASSPFGADGSLELALVIVHSLAAAGRLRYAAVVRRNRPWDRRIAEHNPPWTVSRCCHRLQGATLKKAARTVEGFPIMQLSGASPPYSEQSQISCALPATFFAVHLLRLDGSDWLGRAEECLPDSVGQHTDLGCS